ncbi:MAG: integrase arm-type DNA-binding domain-containing protein [Desulfovibrionaceae bacterium]|nr:integrase arm-type DNA-binding domain-containing protein [Desulfovibrionaceae bacterium]
MPKAGLGGRLSVKEIQQLASENGKQKKVSDGGGLYVFILPSGVKTWYVLYSFGGKQRKLRLGNFPAMGLQEARQAAVDVRRIVDQGKDPAAERQAQKEAHAEQEARGQRTFDALINEWFATKFIDKRESTRSKFQQLRYKHFAPLLEKKLTDITQEDLLNILHNAEKTVGSVVIRSMASRLHALFEFAIASKYLEDNPAENLFTLLPERKYKVKHQPALEKIEDLKMLLNRLDPINFCLANDNPLTYCALNLLMLLGCRKMELCGARWEEVDLEKGIFTIFEDRMKRARPHRIYLSTQAKRYFEILLRYKQNDFVFYGDGKEGHLTGKTINSTLENFCAIDPKQCVPHGFRAILQSVAFSLAAPKELIDMGLSHKTGSDVWQAYLRDPIVVKRMTRFWQWWADTLDAIKAGKEPEKWSE